MDELVTIIVPVYNAYKYIERCMLSITNQTHSALQIIFVNDGSTDGSGDLCDSFAERDERIEVIHRTNGGVSAARNIGLEQVRGEWISFVDSDDYISPYYIEEMLAAAKDGCDIVVCRSVKVLDSATAETAPFQRLPHSRRITGYEASVQHFGENAHILNLSWGKLIRAHLWEGLRYPEEITIGEDMFVSHSLYYNARYVVIMDSVLYAYVQSDGSLLRREFTTTRFDVLDAWEAAVHLFETEREDDLLHIARRVYCSRVFDAKCACKKYLPLERETLSLLHRRAVKAYGEAKPIRGYIDCSSSKSFAYRVKLFIGRWCIQLYFLLFVRGRTLI